MFGALQNEIIGSHTRAEWEDLIATSAWRCFYCGVPVCENSLDSEREATKDHIFPTALGGVDFIWNIVVACFRCNRLKGNRTAEEFRLERLCLPQSVDETTQESTGVTSLRAETDAEISPIARQAVRYLENHLSMPGPEDPKRRRELLKQQAVLIARRRLPQTLEAAGQLRLQFGKPAQSEEVAYREKSA